MGYNIHAGGKKEMAIRGQGAACAQEINRDRFNFKKE
jgi:hypothetical protein